MMPKILGEQISKALSAFEAVDAEAVICTACDNFIRQYVHAQNCSIMLWCQLNIVPRSFQPEFIEGTCLILIRLHL